ncbi:hypothetical protein ERJ75_000387200 [Trypanosoma vivax]|nr:hypothetical protein ERJ75_000387200 [Trypanosoma vivax]
MLGGSSRVVAIAALSGGDSAAEALILSNTAALREVKNTPPRSGNVSRFIAFTQEQEERCAAAVASAKDAKEKARHGFMLQQLRTVLADARELQDRPEGTKLQVYSSSREPRSGGGARGKVPGTDEPCTTPAAGAPRTVGEQQRELGTVAVAKDAGPWAVPVKIVVTGESGPPGDIIEITVEGEKKLCKVDELIRRSGDGVVECDAAKRLQGVLASGHNAALLSAEMAPELPLERQATWGIMQAVLGGVLGMGKTGATKELTLYMSVLCGDQVVADLIGDPRPRQLVLSKSPLFGVLVHEATATVVKEVAQMENVVCGALKRASGLLKKDEYIVCTAVLKQVSSDDVNVASLLVVNALDMRPYMEALEGSSAPSKALFAHAFTGPCSSVVLISYKEMDSRVSNALVAQRRMEPRSKPRSGSVKQFVSVVEKSIAVAEERLKSGERPGQSLSEMKQAVDDAKELLKAPNDRQPTAYVMPQVRESNVDTTIRVAAIVTERRESKSCCVTGGERSFTVTSAGGAKEFPADEVVRRMGHISSVRSLWVDSLVDRFIEGYNTALLTADSDGVSSGRDLMLRLAHSIFSKVSKDGELFVILVSVKPDGTSAKDLQQSEAGYVPLEVASSPLFGPCVAGAKMERAAAADTLLQGLKTAARVCEADGSLLFSLLVYKERKMGNDDVFLSSFLTVLAGADARVYVNGLEKPQKERGLLQYALGGPCLTVFALGLAASTEDTGMATTLGDLAKRVHGMKNGSIRTGSVRRFLAFSTKAVEQLRTWQEKASEGDRERLANRSASVVKVCADAEDLLRDPVGRCPVVYRQEE